MSDNASMQRHRFGAHWGLQLGTEVPGNSTCLRKGRIASVVAIPILEKTRSVDLLNSGSIRA
jgi:hypothetical protein